MPSRTASCCCGQLQIEVQGEPEGVGVCHCFACQRRTGSVFAALAGFRAPFAVTGKATEYVRTGDQGAKFRFRFCPVCGTNLFHTEEATRTPGSRWRWAASRIRGFHLRRTRCTTVAATRGCSCPVASGLTTRTPRISLDEIPIWASKRKPSTRDA
jgi:hypothetical protein